MSSFDFLPLTKFCNPTGPSFDKSSVVQFSISNSIINITLPKNKASDSIFKETKNKPEYNIDHENEFIPHTNSPELNNQSLFHIIIRHWGFKGPIFTGYAGEIHFTMSAYCSLDHKNEGNSLFIPVIFEDRILSNLTAEFGNSISHGSANWSAPINWNTYTNKGIHFYKFDIVPQKYNINSYIKRLYVPISDSCYLLLSATIEQKTSGNLDKRDILVDRSNMNKLTDDVFNSLQINLSSNAYEQQQDALKASSYKNASLTLEPIKWTTHSQDKEHVQFQEETNYFKSLSTKNI